MTPVGILWLSITRVLSRPSVTSVYCIEARSICEYDFTAATSSEMRRVDSLTSASRADGRQVAGDPLQSGPDSVTAVAPSTAAAFSHQRDVEPGGRQRGSDDPVPVDPALGEPVRQRVLPIGDRQRIGTSRRADRCRGAGRRGR